MRLAQTYSEEQGREQARINDALEERLAHLEWNVDRIATLAPDVTKIRAPSCDGNAERSGPSKYGVPLPPSGVLPGEPWTDSRGLLRWIQDVDQRLEELQNLIAVPQKTAASTAAGVPVESVLDAREADVLATSTSGSALTAADVQIESVLDARETDVLATSTSESALTASGVPVESVLDAREADLLATSVSGAAPPGDTASTGSTSANLKLVEERVRRLEETLSKANLAAKEGTSNTEQQVQDIHEEPAGQCITDRGSSKSEPLAAGPGDTIAYTGGSGLAPEGLGPPENRSRSRRCRGSRSRSSSPAGGVTEDGDKHANVDGGVPTGPAASGILEAIEKGREEASRACVAAEEALRVGREAAERSERTGMLPGHLLSV